MKYITLSLISPNFDDEKLKSATFAGLVDIFEDRIRNWFLQPVDCLLEIPHCHISAVAILVAYFEGIEIYQTGVDSRNRSFEFFARGFSKVFPLQNCEERLLNDIHRAFYDQVRCGFVHDGMFRNRVFFSDIHPKPIIFTFPKINDTLETSRIESIVINPKLLFESVRNHFENYLKDLRESNNEELKRNFQAAVDLKWGLDEEDPAIGMTEEEFYAT